MKKIILLLIVAVFAVTAGCVSTGAVKTKCPSCGFEFETPATS